MGGVCFVGISSQLSRLTVGDQQARCVERPQHQQVQQEQPPRQQTQQRYCIDLEVPRARCGRQGVDSRYHPSRELTLDYAVSRKVLGSGASGDVRLAERDGVHYAVKSFVKSALPPQKLRTLKNEAETFLSLDHPHIVRLIDVYDTESELHFVMERMAGGELFDRLMAVGPYPEHRAATTLRQMLLAICYLHSNGLAHRDLKLENFLYEEEDTDHLMLIDFGLAQTVDPTCKMTKICGTLDYLAPEVIGRLYDEKCDCWSLGVLAHSLLTGNPPFTGSDDAQVFRKIKRGVIDHCQRFSALSSEAQNFINALLVVDPNKRLSAKDAVAHKFLSASEPEFSIGEGLPKLIKAHTEASGVRRACFSMMAWSSPLAVRKSLRAGFVALDSSHSGTVSMEDLKRVLETKCGINASDAAELVSCLEANGGQEWCYSDFLAVCLQGQPQCHEDLLRSTFRHFDRDGTGTISRESLWTVLGDSFQELELELSDGAISCDDCIKYFARETPNENQHIRLPEPKSCKEEMLSTGPCRDALHTIPCAC